MEEQARFEGVGENFDLRMMMLTRQKTQEAIQRIAAAIKPGMAEEAAHEWARTVLREAGLLRGWHGIQLRFGPNTLKPFGAPSEPGTVLRDNDIFFIDIGPVWDKWEGDGGATFVVGNDPDMLRIARDVQEVFARVRRKWLTERVSGQALYQYAGEEARSLGWELNLKMAGHRLADFPHAAIHKGSLADAAFAPSPSLWVLEIQIRHPERPFSAFYEDLLLAD